MMSLSTLDVAHILFAVAALYLATQLGGLCFAALRQPRALGEIVGGLLVGPTGLGALAPNFYAWLFPTNGPTQTALAALYQLGLLVLMFTTGATIKSPAKPSERWPVAIIAFTGLAIPFLASLVPTHVYLANTAELWGPRATAISVTLVLGIALAVTSIPVISRIMLDLGILHTAFARIVLSVALVEDLILYVVLAVALGFTTAPGSAAFGLPGVLGLTRGSVESAIFQLLITLGVIWVSVSVLPRVYARWRHLGSSTLVRADASAPDVLFILFTLGACIGCGLEPFIAAMVCGVAVGSVVKQPRPTPGSTQLVAMYFGLVGFRLDLAEGFNVYVLIGLMVYGCCVKLVSVYAGARLANFSHASSLNLAVAMNARGGPAIVLASVTLDAGIISYGFHSILVLFAILTSLAAGAWLERVPKEQLLQDNTPELYAPKMG